MRKLSPFFDVAKHFHSPLLVVDIELESLNTVVVSWWNNQHVTNKYKWHNIWYFSLPPNEKFNFEWVFDSSIRIIAQIMRYIQEISTIIDQCHRKMNLFYCSLSSITIYSSRFELFFKLYSWVPFVFEQNATCCRILFVDLCCVMASFQMWNFW